MSVLSSDSEPGSAGREHVLSLNDNPFKHVPLRAGCVVGHLDQEVDLANKASFGPHDRQFGERDGGTIGRFKHLGTPNQHASVIPGLRNVPDRKGDAPLV